MELLPGIALIAVGFTLGSLAAAFYCLASKPSTTLTDLHYIRITDVGDQTITAVAWDIMNDEPEAQAYDITRGAVNVHGELQPGSFGVLAGFQQDGRLTRHFYTELHVTSKRHLREAA